MSEITQKFAGATLVCDCCGGKTVVLLCTLVTSLPPRGGMRRRGRLSTCLPKKQIWLPASPVVQMQDTLCAIPMGSSSCI